MKPKYFWIKERHNPQFDKPYFVRYGNISIKEAEMHQNAASFYGSSYMNRFNTEEEYNNKIKELKEQGNRFV